MDVLDGAAEQGGSDDALGYLGGFIGSIFGLDVQEGVVDVALEVRVEPGG